jgi:hypothetical protein
VVAPAATTPAPVAPVTAFASAFTTLGVTGPRLSRSLGGGFSGRFFGQGFGLDYVGPALRWRERTLLGTWLWQAALLERRTVGGYDIGFLIVLLKFHEVGDVEEGIPLKADVYKG